MPTDVWQQVKLHYIGLLIEHHQPECAETFFNSVTPKILHRSYFRNDFIFVRPAISTEYIENDEPAAQPTYRAYYPTRETLREHLAAHRHELPARARVRGPRPRRRRRACRRCAQHLGETQLRANFQIQVLSSLFFRNKGAYVVGKIINGFSELPFALPILHDRNGQARDRRRALRRRRPAAALQLRARLLHGRHGGAVGLRAVPALDDAAASRAPRSTRARPAEAGQDPLLPRLPAAHLRHSSDQFRIAPGIKGMVMLVFDLPSFPVRVQGDQGFLSAAEGHDARADQGQVPARQAARPRRPHGRHARVLQRRLPARPLRATS